MDVLSELRSIVPEDRLCTDGEEIQRHGRAFFTYLAPHAPDAVVFPTSREEVPESLIRQRLDTVARRYLRDLRRKAYVAVRMGQT